MVTTGITPSIMRVTVAVWHFTFDRGKGVQVIAGGGGGK